MAAPTLTSYAQSTWTDSNSTSEVTGTLTWNAGDTIYVVASSENDAITLGVPTATGLTFSLVTSTSASINCRTYLWTATAGSSGSGAITATSTGGSGAKGIAAFAYNGQGIGNTATVAGASTPTRSLTRAYADSAVICVIGDWNAVGDATVTGSPSSGATQRVAAAVAGSADFFVFSWSGQGAAGSTSYGITGHTGGKYSIIVVEVRGTAEAAAASFLPSRASRMAQMIAL